MKEKTTNPAGFKSRIIDLAGPSWGKDLYFFFDKNPQIFEELKKDPRTIYPEEKNLFRAFQLCPKNETKIVILGQDPYHTPGKANGLAFSVNNGKAPSLTNIQKEVYTDIYQESHVEDRANLDEYIPTDLSPWAAQGVLLLNTALTVARGAPGSHLKLWEPFTEYIFKEIFSHMQPLIFMLWGKKAQKYKELISSQHHILEAAHPSPYSASSGFFGCKHFSKANQILSEKNQEICW
jgi:uracil-DNA glycosylase